VLADAGPDNGGHVRSWEIKRRSTNVAATRAFDPLPSSGSRSANEARPIDPGMTLWAWADGETGFHV
jgi:hypothetical protein